MTQRNPSVSVDILSEGYTCRMYTDTDTFGAPLKFNIRLILRRCCLHAIHATIHIIYIASWVHVCVLSFTSIFFPYKT